jgi:2',3'-cyclic-nucleotide 2'-phosphodiesterase (5'-nucleotidase family)
MNPQFPPQLGGGGSMATYINEVRALSDGVHRSCLLMDIGDFFQGHPIGTVTDGQAVIKYMNMMGFDLTVIGNHEYDIPEDRLINTYSLAEFPVLSCNVYRDGTDQLVEYATPYLIFEKDGHSHRRHRPHHHRHRRHELPRSHQGCGVPRRQGGAGEVHSIVREQEHADIVIGAGHMGLPYEPEPVYQRRYIKYGGHYQRFMGYDAQELAHEVQGIDLFVGGHMHKGFQAPWEDPVTHTLVIQGYAYGSNIGHFILKIDKDTKTITGWTGPAEGEFW